MRRFFAPLVLTAAVLAGCGQSNPALIPQANADALTQTADKVQSACDADDRTAARRELRNLEQEIDALPSAVDQKLRENLQAWAAQIQKRISQDCKTEETPTPSPSESPTEAPTESATPTETTSPKPTETPTAAPTETPTPTNTAAPTEQPTTTPAADANTNADGH
jgi:outer membrane biosynthesis protein TonB